jgi:glutamine amidotransferase
MHNGQIGNWSLLRRDIESMISKDYYNYRLGTTDSEALFLLALSCGLEKDPVGGIKKAIEKIHILLEAYGATEPLRLSAALSDGKSIWAFRYSSDHQSPSLFYGTPDLHKKQGQSRMINTIASEPFDDDSEHWTSVGESKVILWKNKAVSVSSFI